MLFGKPFLKNKTALMYSVILNILIHLWLHWVFIAVCSLSLVATSRSYSSRLMCGHLVAASLVAEHRLSGLQPFRTGSVVAHGFGCSAACGVFSDQRPNLSCFGRWILNPGLPGQSWNTFLTVVSVLSSVLLSYG